MATTFVDIGSTANDGTGDPIRDAFTTVNNNFDLINDTLFSGLEPSIISAVHVTAGYIFSNTYVRANTYVNADSIVGNTVTSYGNLFVSQDGAYIIGNVNIIGNLNVSGSQAASQSQQSSSPILALHYSATPLVTNDGTDIGTEWQYYKGAEKRGFLGWQNSTETLVYMDDITDTANVISGTYGNVRFGSLFLSNTTAATSNTSGALRVAGGVSSQGNVYVAGNVVTTGLSVTGNVRGSLWLAGGADTIYIGGSPVVTSATAFNGGAVGLDTQFNSTTAATSTGTGAVRFAGGIGVTGNAYIGGNLVLPTASSNISGNLVGNVLTASQPGITSLGSLTSLTMGGPINAQSIVPASNLTYTLGTGNTTRWSKLWVYDIDSSGSLSGQTGSFNSVTVSANTTTANLTATNTTTANLTATGAVRLTAVTTSTSTSTGALVVDGGLGVAGNIVVPTIYISNGIRWLGNSLAFASGTFTEVVSVSNTAAATSTSTGALVVTGGVGIGGNLVVTNIGDVSANIGSVINSVSATRARSFTSVMVFGG